jgi:hypothetical protein
MRISAPPAENGLQAAVTLLKSRLALATTSMRIHFGHAAGKDFSGGSNNTLIGAGTFAVN